MPSVQEIIDAATSGRWYFEENERCQQLFAEDRFRGFLVHPIQLMKAPKQSDIFAPYWLSGANKRYIAEMNPTHAGLMEAEIQAGRAFARDSEEGLSSVDKSWSAFCEAANALDTYRKERGLNG